MTNNLVQKAEQYARLYHQGQFRKGDKQPYIVHPQGVVELLKKFEHDDEASLAMGWLHDTLEDTSLTYDEMKDIFGAKVADGVYLLTRNVDRSAYKERLQSASTEVQMVKLCDTLHNVATMSCLSARGIARKVADCQDFYIPLARNLCPLIAEEMEQHIQPYMEQ